MITLLIRFCYIIVIIVLIEKGKNNAHKAWNGIRGHLRFIKKMISANDDEYHLQFYVNDIKFQQHKWHYQQYHRKCACKYEKDEEK